MRMLYHTVVCWPKTKMQNYETTTTITSLLQVWSYNHRLRYQLSLRNVFVRNRCYVLKLTTTHAPGSTKTWVECDSCTVTAVNTIHTIPLLSPLVAPFYPRLVDPFSAPLMDPLPLSISLLLHLRYLQPFRHKWVGSTTYLVLSVPTIPYYH
jgi:hypothetical protein